MNALSPAENAFVEALIDLGDPAAAAASAGVQPSLGHDPRVQSEMVDRLRQQGALDAVYARKVLRDLAQSADNDGIRFRAASLLWERGLGKVPDTVNVNVNLEQLDRASLHTEIKQLIAELGMPPLVEGDFEEVVGDVETIAGHLINAVEAVPELADRLAEDNERMLEQRERSEPLKDHEQPYVPALPQKWQ